MLPVVRGEAVTRAASILALCPAAARRDAVTGGDWARWAVYLVAAAGLGAVFVLRAVRLLRQESTGAGLAAVRFSNVYLALLYLAMVVDRLVALGGIGVLLWGLLATLLAAGVALIVMGLACAGWIGELRHGT